MSVFDKKCGNKTFLKPILVALLHVGGRMRWGSFAPCAYHPEEPRWSSQADCATVAARSPVTVSGEAPKRVLAEFCCCPPNEALLCGDPEDETEATCCGELWTEEEGTSAPPRMGGDGDADDLPDRCWTDVTAPLLTKIGTVIFVSKFSKQNFLVGRCDTRRLASARESGCRHGDVDDRSAARSRSDVDATEVHTPSIIGEKIGAPSP